MVPAAREADSPQAAGRRVTPAQVRRAELVAAAIHCTRTLDGGQARTPCRLVKVDHGDCLAGDQRLGWVAGGRKRPAIVRGQPPDTVDGWAGWLAAHMGWDHHR